MSLRTLLCFTSFCFAFVVNPGYITGCSTSDSEPEFGEAEMLELLDAANEQGRWQLESGGKTYEIELSFMQAAAGAPGEQAARAPRRPLEPGSLFGTRAHACGTRTFTQRASACVTFTEVPLVGELTVRELSPTPHVIVDAVEIEARLWTDAHRLLFAYLDFEFEDNRVVLHSPDAESWQLQRVDAMALGEDMVDLSFEADEGSR
jgi:hypothetical protein